MIRSLSILVSQVLTVEPQKEAVHPVGQSWLGPLEPKATVRIALTQWFSLSPQFLWFSGRAPLISKAPG